MLGIWLFLIVSAYLFDFFASNPDLVRGENRSNVEKLYGEPYYEFSNSVEASRANIGYAVPSPWRYTDKYEKIRVYNFDGKALWVFFNDDKLVDYFVGGSYGGLTRHCNMYFLFKEIPPLLFESGVERDVMYQRM